MLDASGKYNTCFNIAALDESNKLRVQHKAAKFKAKIGAGKDDEKSAVAL
jgi:hypothetical protein